MAQPRLNVQTSVVDFLKSQGKASDFTSRARMFRELGLEERLGTFKGTAAQNTALLRILREQQAAQAASPATVEERAPQPPPEPRVEDSRPTPTPQGGESPPTADQFLQPVPSEEELFRRLLESSEFRLRTEREALETEVLSAEAAAEKERLAAETQKSVREFQESLGRRGLVFSGQFVEGTNRLIESLAASKLNVDRKLAANLLRRDIAFREETLKEVSKLVEDAQKQNDKAIQQLNQAGFAVIGNQLVPTLSAQRLEALEEQRQIQNDIAALRLQMAQEKNEEQLRLAEERLRLAEERFAFAQEKQSAAERRATSAIRLFSEDIAASVSAGHTPRETLNEVVRTAANQGLLLEVEDQTAILDYATRLFEEREIPQETKPEPATAQPTTGFFETLFNWNRSFWSQ